jgi:hypothetical protein
MAINPDNITTIRVDQLAPATLDLTKLIPIAEVNGELKQSTIQDLADLIATTISASGGVGFLPLVVTNGQQLPDVPTDASFFLCGAGTYLNVNGYPDVICTEALNAVVSLTDHWQLAVEIPIVAEVGVQTVTGSAVDNTDPLNPVINSTGGGGSVDSVTGPTVDNTDPTNPIVNIPTIQQTATAGSPNTDLAVYIENSVNGDVVDFGSIGLIIESSLALNPLIHNFTREGIFASYDNKQTGLYRGLIRHLWAGTNIVDLDFVQPTGTTGKILFPDVVNTTKTVAMLESPTFTGVVTTPEISLTSTTKGFTPNALTTTQRNAISSPTAGLMIFNTTLGYPEYFDTYWGWMPLYTSNEWKARNGIEYFNDLSTTLSGDGMILSSTASGSVSYASSGISNRMGIAILSTATSASGRAWIGQGAGTTATLMRMGGGRIIHETSVRIPTLSDGTQRFQFLSGLSSINNSTSIGSGILFAYDEGGVSAGSSATPNWQVATMNGGFRTWTTITSVPVVAGQYYRLTIEINDACTSVVFKIDGTTVRTETLTLPSATDIGLMTQIYKSIGTTARTVEVDYISFKQKFTTPR